MGPVAILRHSTGETVLAAVNRSFKNADGNGPGVARRGVACQTDQQRGVFLVVNSVRRVRHVARPAARIGRTSGIDGRRNRIGEEELRSGLCGDVSGGIEDAHLDVNKSS